MYALPRDFQLLSASHQLRCEVPAGSHCTGVPGGRMTAPFARMLIIPCKNRGKNAPWPPCVIGTSTRAYYDRMALPLLLPSLGGLPGIMPGEMPSRKGRSRVPEGVV